MSVLQARALPSHELTCQRENCTISSQNETFRINCSENTYPNVKILIIKMDKLKQFPSDVLKCFPNLQIFEAENMTKLNDLPKFEAHDDTKKLKVLKFSNNNFNGDMSGGKYRFTRVRHVKFLSFARNAIRKVACKAFFGLSELVTLDLSFNSIETFACDFEIVPSLKTLRLNNNQLATLSTMPKYSKLSMLFLQHNNLKTIEFKNATGFFEEFTTNRIDDESLEYCSNICRNMFYGNRRHFKISRRCENPCDMYNLKNFKTTNALNLESGDKELETTVKEFIINKMTCLLVDNSSEIILSFLMKVVVSAQFQLQTINNITHLKRIGETECKEEFSDNDYALYIAEDATDFWYMNIIFIVGSTVIGVLLLVIIILIGFLVKKRGLADSTYETVPPKTVQKTVPETQPSAKPAQPRQNHPKLREYRNHANQTTINNCNVRSIDSFDGFGSIEETGGQEEEEEEHIIYGQTTK
jgi:Leucine-rich repeat (LRR) protein